MPNQHTYDPRPSTLITGPSCPLCQSYIGTTDRPGFCPICNFFPYRDPKVRQAILNGTIKVPDSIQTLPPIPQPL